MRYKLRRAKDVSIIVLHSVVTKTFSSSFQRCSIPKMSGCDKNLNCVLWFTSQEVKIAF